MPPKSELPPTVEDTHKRARVRGETGSDQNQLRGQLYGAAFDRIKAGLVHGNYFEVILLCDSLIGDRIEAMIQTIKHEDSDQYPTESMGSALGTLQREAKVRGVRFDKPTRQFFEQLNKFASERNVAVHSFVIVNNGNRHLTVEDRPEQVKETAEKGAELAREVADRAPSLLKFLKPKNEPEPWFYAEAPKRRHLDHDKILHGLRLFTAVTPPHQRTYNWYKTKWCPENPLHSYSKDAFDAYFGGFERALEKIDAPREHSHWWVRADQEAILENVKEFCLNFDQKSRTRKKYKEWKGRKFAPETIAKYFGSFKGAILEVGEKPSSSLGAAPMTPKEMVDAFERICIAVYKKTQKRPARKDIKEYIEVNTDGIAYETLVRAFGPYKRFVEHFYAYKKGEISLSDVLNLGKETYKKAVISSRLRFDILNRDKFTCVLCGAKAPDVELVIDHIKPESKGGETEPENLRVLCFDCNAGRSNRYND